MRSPTALGRLAGLGAVFLAAIIGLVPGGCPPFGSNRPPEIADFRVEPAEANVGSVVRFSWRAADADGDLLHAVVSTDSDGRSDYRIDDARATSQVEHAYRSAGPFRAKLRVSDGVDEASREVTLQISGPIRAYVVAPAPGATVEDAVPVEALVQSELETLDVVATVDGRSATLRYDRTFLTAVPDDPTGYVRGPIFVGELSLAGLPVGDKLITLQVRDTGGNRAETYRAVIFNHAPQLVVTEPIDESVATPRLRIRATCSDADGEECRITITGRARGPYYEYPTGLPEQELLTTTGGIDEDVDCSPLGEGSHDLVFSAVDSGGRSIAAPLVIYVHVIADPRWSIVQLAPGRIVDARADRVLWVGSPANRMEPAYRTSIAILNRATQFSTSIPVPLFSGEVIDAPSATFTDSGATCYGLTGAGGRFQIVRRFDWDGAVLHTTSLGWYGVPPHTYYPQRQLSNLAWTAQVLPGNLGQDQVALRGPSGEERVVTGYGSEPATIHLEFLSLGGELFYWRAGRRYRVSFEQAPDDVGPAIGEIIPLDSGWHLALGRALLRFSP